MSKPVNKIEFWKDRLNNARDLRHSVYITSSKDWDFLNGIHENILKPYKDSKVLDAGCGYGRWSQFFNNYVGVDFSPDFIDKAKELYKDTQFIQAYLAKLPIEDDHFDLSFCVSLMFMIENKLGKAAWIPM